MEYTLIATSNGPVINIPGGHVVIVDTQDMIALAEEGDDFLNQMEKHIATEAQAAMTAFLEGFSANMHMMPAKMYAYVNAAQQFLQFKNNNWAQYVHNRDNPPHA